MSSTKSRETAKAGSESKPDHGHSGPAPTTGADSQSSSQAVPEASSESKPDQGHSGSAKQEHAMSERTPSTQEEDLKGLTEALRAVDATLKRLGQLTLPTNTPGPVPASAPAPTQPSADDKQATDDQAPAAANRSGDDAVAPSPKKLDTEQSSETHPANLPQIQALLEKVEKTMKKLAGDFDPPEDIQGRMDDLAQLLSCLDYCMALLKPTAAQWKVHMEIITKLGLSSGR